MKVKPRMNAVRYWNTSLGVNILEDTTVKEVGNLAKKSKAIQSPGIIFY